MDEHTHANEHDWLAQRFEAERPHLRAVAYRMLGSPSEADDAVQESWLRLSRSDTGGVENLGAWLTTVVARICLDLLRARAARREDSLESLDTPDARDTRGARIPEPATPREDGSDPEREALLADAVGLALLVVLDTLTPAERLAFVLHDLFDVPFDTIAPIIDRSPAATRQLASRARRRVRGQGQAREAAPVAGANLPRQRAIVAAFLAAARAGDFNALLALLDPGVVFRADRAAVTAGASSEVRGAPAVAQQFAGRARVAQPALVNGAAGAVWASRGQPRVVFSFTITGDKISAIELIADPARLSQLDVRLDSAAQRGAD